MAPPDDREDKPWKRLYHVQSEQQQEADPQQLGQQPGQQQQPQQPQQLSELQQRMLQAYRKTCLVAGAGMAGSAWLWHTRGRAAAENVFLPPRAQALPPQLVADWKRKAAMREGMRTVGRQTLFVSWVAALYFGAELAAEVARGGGADWRNTAAGGAVAGGYLGASAPSSMRGRTFALGCIAGGLLGALSGWSQQQLTEMAAAAELAGGEQQQQQQQRPDRPPS